MKFRELSYDWLESKRNVVKESTFYLYKYSVNKYLDRLMGDVPIKKINESYIMEILAKFQKEKSLRKEKLKNSTVKNLFIILRQILKFGAKKNLVKFVDFKLNLTAESYRHAPETYEFSEQKEIMQKILKEKSGKSFGVLLSFSIGLRMGEICALKWKDIDFKNKTLCVEKTLQRIGKKISVGSPKTATSRRVVPIPDEIFDILCSIRINSSEDFVVSNSQKIVEPRCLRRYFKSFCEKNCIRQLRFHCLRHTFATRCIQNGVDCKTVSEILGHSNVTTTLNLYVHPSMEQKRKCVNIVKFF